MKKRDAKNRSLALILLILTVLISLSPPQIARAQYDAVTIGTTDVRAASPQSTQRKTFYAVGLFWVFYYNVAETGATMAYRSSSDGITWSSETILRSGGATTYGSSIFSVFYDESDNRIHYVYAYPSGSNPLKYARGRPYSNGTIIWQTAQNVLDSHASRAYYKPDIAVDENGYPWVTVTYYSWVSGNYYALYLFKSDDDAGGWNEEFYRTLDSKSSLWSGRWASSIKILGTGIDGSAFVSASVLWSVTTDLEALYLSVIRADDTMLINKQTVSSFSLEGSTGDQVASFADSVNSSGGLRITYTETGTGDLYHRDFDYPNLGTETLLQTQASTASFPVQSINEVDTVYLLWMNNSYIYYREWYSNGTWTSTSIWVNETALTIPNNYRIGASEEFFNDRMCLMWMAHSSGSTLRFSWRPTYPRVETNLGEIIGGLEIYDPEFSLNETWIFTGRTYIASINYSYVDGIGYLHELRARIRDGYNIMVLEVDFQNDTGSVISGSDGIYFLGYETENISSTTLQVDFSFQLEENEVLDVLNTTLSAQGTETLHSTTSDWDVLDYFNIYNQGGLTKYLFSGDAERIPGGGPLDMRIGTDYIPADIIEDDFEDGYLGSSWETWDNGTAQVGIVHGWSEGTGLRTGYTDPYILEVTSPAGNQEYAWARFYYPPFVSDGESYNATFYLYLNDNSSQYNSIEFEDGQGTIKASIDFGYAGFIQIHLYNQTGASFINTTQTWENLTWFRMDVRFNMTDTTSNYLWNYEVFIDGVSIGTVLNAFTTEYGDLYQPQRIYYYSLGSSGIKSMYVDSISLYTDWAGGTGGSAIAKVHFVNLQAFHSDFLFEIPYGDLELSEVDGTIPYNTYVEFTLEYVNQSLIWEEGPSLRITPIGGRSTGSDQWVVLWASHLYNDTTVNAKSLYAFWEGEGGEKDLFHMWIDAWFSEINYTSTYGFRTNAFYYGVQDTTNPWFRWLLGSNWGIMGQENDRAEGYGDLLNSTGHVISARLFPMSRIRIHLWRNASMEWEVQVRGWEDGEYKRLGPNDAMRGVPTPIYHSPLMPNLPAGSWFMGLAMWVLGAIQGLIREVLTLWNQATLYFVQTVIPLIDSFLFWIFPALGPEAFTAFVAGMNTLLATLSTWLGYFVTLIGYGASLIVQVMTFLATSFIYIVTLFASMVSNAIAFIQFVSSFFQGGYSTGINIWTDLQGSTWLFVATVFYPVWIFQRCSITNNLQPLVWHMERWKDIFAFILDLMTRLYNLVVGTIHKLIEMIPVVE